MVYAWVGGGVRVKQTKANTKRLLAREVFLLITAVCKSCVGSRNSGARRLAWILARSVSRCEGVNVNDVGRGVCGHTMGMPWLYRTCV